MGELLTRLGIDRMSREDRLQLVDDILFSLDREEEDEDGDLDLGQLDPDLVALLEERLADCERNPDDQVPLEVAFAEDLAKLQDSAR
jgi:putative addiction module component (TIGR02574 family)